MRCLLLVLVAALAACSADVTAADDTPRPAPVPYEVKGRAETGVGPFRAHLACSSPDDEILSGTCVYQNVTPEPGTARSGVDDDGWFCAGRAPQLTPFGWVEMTATCVAPTR